jgi:hypothetical protein
VEGEEETQVLANIHVEVLDEETAAEHGHEPVGGADAPVEGRVGDVAAEVLA